LVRRREVPADLAQRPDLPTRRVGGEADERGGVLSGDEQERIAFIGPRGEHAARPAWSLWAKGPQESHGFFRRTAHRAFQVDAPPAFDVVNRKPEAGGPRGLGQGNGLPF